MSGESYCPECSAVMSGLPHNCTQGSVGLTDEEISLALSKQGYTDEVHAELEVVAEAQLKKVMEWGNEDCEEHPYTSRSKGEAYNRKHHRCPECWQGLLEEVKE